MEGVEKDAAFSYADESKIDAALNGKKIAVKGYLVGVNKSGYPQVIVTSIKEATATRSLAATRATTILLRLLRSTCTTVRTRHGSHTL